MTSTNTAVSQNYSNGTAVGNVYASDANLQFIEGTGQEYPFGSTFSPRIFNGVIHYSRPGTYAWSTGATTQSITVAPNTASSYSCTINVPSISCTVSDTIDITVSALPTVNLGNDTAFCAPAALTLDAGNAGNTFAWNNGSTTQTISASTSAAYSVMVTDSNGCTGTDTLNLTVNPKPVVTLGSDTLLCPGTSLNMDAGNPGASYAWSTGGSNQSEVVSGGFSGAVLVVVTDGLGCSGSDTVLIAATSGILDLGADTSICTGANATLDAGATNTGWLWSTGDTTQNIVVGSAGTYTASAYAGDGCLLSDTVVLTALSAPVASFTASTTSLTLNITNNSTDATSYAWDFGDGNSSTAATPAHTYATDGSYTVTLIVTNACGSDTSTFTLTAVGIVDGSDFELAVYPNPSQGDFMVRAEGLQAGNLELTIYALDGKAVCRSQFEANGTAFELPVKADLPSGNYLLRLVAGEQQVTRRISIQ